MINVILQRREHLLLVALLESLHVALWTGLDDPLSQSLLLIHFGMFAIWQPFQESGEKISWYNGVIFIVLALAIAYWITWQLAIGWLILLIGIVGGRVVTNQLERYTYLLVMIVLFLELFIICIPNLLLTITKFPEIQSIQIFIALLPVTLFLFPRLSRRATELSVDLLHAITTSLLTALLALGSVVIVYSSNLDYLTALFQAFLVVGTGMIIISWLLSSNRSSGGLSQVWTRSLLNIGTPFEQWLQDLTRLKNRYESPGEFLDAAMVKLVSLSWVSGVKWQQNGEEQMHGIKTTHNIEQQIGGQPVTIYTEVKISGALLLHCNLLIQLIEYLYEAKVNEQQLAIQTHLQAVYETGARITHDIKNLLQSMHSMITILQADNLAGDSRSLTILRKQFPYFIQRLEQAVYKLQAPEKLDETNEIYLKDWWQDLRSHYKNRDISFTAEIEENPLVPFELFNNVAENLVENAISKRKEETGITISINLVSRRNLLQLEVTDTGTAIEPELTSSLFREPVKSYDGFGIGLLQAARLANMAGYSLELVDNTDGNVCFRLKKENNSG